MKTNKTEHLKKVRIKREGKFENLDITQLTKSELKCYLESREREFLIELVKKLVFELNIYKPEFNFEFEFSEFDIVARKKKPDDS